MCPETWKGTNYSPLSQGEITQGWLRSGFWHQAAPEPGEDRRAGSSQPAPQRILTLWRNWGRGGSVAGSRELTACSHPEPHKARRLINRVNCKEGTLSKQADLTHCGIKEHPSLETPSLTPSTCNKNQKPSASRLALLQLPTEPCTRPGTQEMLCFDYFNRYLFSLPNIYCSFSW